MNSFIEAIDPQTVLVVAAIAIALLLRTLLIRILKAGAGLILTILAIVLVLQYLFGISPEQLWSEIANLPQAAIQWVKSFDLNALSSAFSG
jgi:hypothetical protein